MSLHSRIVLPETLDALDPADPQARRSRRDLRRVHLAMRTLAILKHAVGRLGLRAPPRRIVELGGGDGSLTLRLAQAMRPGWPDVALTILDRHDIVDTQTIEEFAKLGWQAKVARQDVLEWTIAPPSQHYDLCITSLFLHHFDDATLRMLLRAIAVRCDAFVACEPHRGALAAVGSALIGILGTNRVTREDAVTSVAAGFTRQELTAIWPIDRGLWSCAEYTALPFTHCFTAVLDRRRTASP
jgi:hypothetical protein